MACGAGMLLTASSWKFQVRVALCPSGSCATLSHSSYTHLTLYPLSSFNQHPTNQTLKAPLCCSKKVAVPRRNESTALEGLIVRVSSARLVFGCVFDQHSLSFTRDCGTDRAGVAQIVRGRMYASRQRGGQVLSRASKVLETLTRHGVTVIEPCSHELHIS